MDNVLILLSVKRVCWLRAKALEARWNEEELLVSYEMRWTINWFNHQKGIWVDRAKQIGAEEGAKCLAWRQSEMWGQLADQAESAFGSDARGL